MRACFDDAAALQDHDAVVAAHVGVVVRDDEQRAAAVRVVHGVVYQARRAAVHRRVYGGKLVLVDEATGGVDAWRDQIVREMIRDYFRGCTVLIVAHRSETVADSNISFKMVRGRVKSYKHWF